MAISSMSPFATFMIIGPTCFFLGILFASFPYDYYVLWSTPPEDQAPFLSFLTSSAETSTLSAAAALREPYLAILEHHIRFLHASPPLISRVLHIAIGTGIAGLLAKLYKPSEANMLFDGASLVLYVCGIVVYLTNIVKGMRIVTKGYYGGDMSPAGGAYDPATDALSAGDSFGVSAGEAAAIAGSERKAKAPIPADTEFIGREDSLRVMAASNTILALVLVGVLVLQAGQWYAQKKEQAEQAEMDRLAKLKKTGGGAGEKGGNGSTGVASGSEVGVGGASSGSGGGEHHPSSGGGGSSGRRKRG